MGQFPNEPGNLVATSSPEVAPISPENSPLVASSSPQTNVRSSSSSSSSSSSGSISCVDSSSNNNTDNNDINRSKFNIYHLDREPTNQSIQYYHQVATKRTNNMGQQQQQQHYYYANLNEKLTTSPICEDAPYLMAGVSPEHHNHHHQNHHQHQSPTSSAGSSSSSSSSSYHSMMQNNNEQHQSYHNHEFQLNSNNQNFITDHHHHQQQQHSNEPQNQDNFRLQLPSAQQQHQVSSQIDDHSITISSAINTESHLTYNYDNQDHEADQEACAAASTDTWTIGSLQNNNGNETGSDRNQIYSSNDNRSSQTIERSPLNHQSSSAYQQLSLVGHFDSEEMQQQQQQQQISAATNRQQQQAYSSQQVELNNNSVLKTSALADLQQDFNNNQDHLQQQHHHHQSATFSALVPMSANNNNNNDNNNLDDHLQGSSPTESSYCNLNGDLATTQDHIFQATNGGNNFYQHQLSDQDEPTSYQQQQHHNHINNNHYHQQDEYHNQVTMQQALPSFQTTMNGNNQQSTSTTIEPLTQISRISSSYDHNQQFQTQTNNLHCYQTANNPQQQQQQHLSNHIYLQDDHKSLYKVNGNCLNGVQQHHHQHQQFVDAHDQPDNQFPFKQHHTPYTSLQQLTTNCDSYTNQVSTTTTTTTTTNDANIMAPDCTYQAPNNTMNNNKARQLKGRRGRPRKKGLRSKNKVNGKLWEFIRDLLLNERTNPTFIRWERREDGVFKFVQSDKVAKMWGERKQNPKMTYEKLSRAMRYYYKSKVLLPVFGRRLVYKFGPNATGWLPSPNETMF